MITLGIDRLIEEEAFKERKIGLVTNPSGVTKTGVPTWKALLQNGYSLSVLFGPEHGFRGEAQDAVQVEDEVFNGIKVISLFGERLAPAPSVLRDIDTILVDIQEVGCRFYTYLYTLAYTMEQCGKEGKSIVVLDRPNPIGDLPVEGNPIEKKFESFVGGFSLPVVHGFTIGEYALYLKHSFFPDVDLKIVEMKGYTKYMPFHETKLPWPLPSPNLPTLETARVYPGTCLFEGTTLSEGRGTCRPFEIIGAPWVNGEALREALERKAIAGAVFTSLFFTPTFSKYKEEVCEGVFLHVTDRTVFRPFYTAVVMLSVLKEMYPEPFRWKPDWDNENEYFFDKLAGSDKLRTLIDENVDADEIYLAVSGDFESFNSRAEDCHIY